MKSEHRDRVVQGKFPACPLKVFITQKALATCWEAEKVASGASPSSRDGRDVSLGNKAGVSALGGDAMPQLNRTVNMWSVAKKKSTTIDNAESVCLLAAFSLVSE